MRFLSKMTDRKQPDILSDIAIAAPCQAKWEDMQGDDVARFCGMCELNVYNVAEMTGQEVADLMTKSEGRACLRLYRRQDGTLITKDCPVGVTVQERLERVRRRMQTAAAVVLAFLHIPAAMAQDKGNSSARMGDVLGGKPMPATQSLGGLVAPPTAGMPIPTRGKVMIRSNSDKVDSSEHADTRALDSYNKARSLEQAKALDEAASNYECALKTLSEDAGKHDKKFVDRVAGDYNKLLKQMGNKARSKEIVKRYGLK